MAGQPTTANWILTRSIKAAGDESANQYKLMKLDSSGDFLICSGATDVPVGVLLDKPDAAGKSGLIGIIGVGFAVGAAALNEGEQIGTDGSGLLDKKIPGTDTTEFVVGQVLQGSTAANDLVVCSFNFATPHRSA